MSCRSPSCSFLCALSIKAERPYNRINLAKHRHNSWHKPISRMQCTGFMDYLWNRKCVLQGEVVSHTHVTFWDECVGGRRGVGGCPLSPSLRMRPQEPLQFIPSLCSLLVYFSKEPALAGTAPTAKPPSCTLCIVLMYTHSVGTLSAVY